MEEGHYSEICFGQRIIASSYCYASRGWLVAGNARYHQDSERGQLVNQWAERRDIDLLCKVGNGLNISLWSDPWAGSVPLCKRYPRIFAISNDKTANIADVGFFFRGSWVWDFHFKRPFFDWELEIHSDFLSTINSIFPATNSADSLIWCLDNTSCFSVKSLCKWA